MSYTDYVIGILDRAAASCMTMPEFINTQLEEWKMSKKHGDMLEAESYFRNRSSVQGKTKSMKYSSNVKIEHPILRKLIDQKTNYLLSNSWAITSDNEKYSALLNEIFDDTARQTIKNWGRETIKKGIGWVQIYFADNKLRLKKLKSEQIIPCWLDEEHTRLDGIIKFYPQTIYEGRLKKQILKVEFWSKNGVEYFVKRDGIMTYDSLAEYDTTHFKINGVGFNWAVPPFICIKYNEEEIPLLYYIKELIDDINWQESITADVLRDIVNFIYVIKNYEGADLDEFIKELRKSKAIKVSGDGGVDKLQADLNIEAVMKLLDKHRKDIYDYARSVDTQDPNLGNASGLALKFRYSDLDMDMNDLEAEIQFAFEKLKPFIDDYLLIMQKGDYKNENFEISFKRDVMINEVEIIDNVVKSQGQISDRTRLARHPWVEDIDKELELLEAEKQKSMEEFGGGLFDNILKPGDNSEQTPKEVKADGEE